MQARPRDDPDQLAASFPLDRQHQRLQHHLQVAHQGDRDAVCTEWLNLHAACNEIKTKSIIRTEANTAADITSEEGVH